MNNIGKINKDNSFYSIVKGFLVALMLSVICILIYAAILVNTNIQESTIKTVIIIISGISILIGSSISSLKIKKKGIFNGVCVGGLYFFSLYILSSIALCGFYFNINSIMMITTGMLLGGIGGVVGVNIGK